jgi:hypothetical protein
MWRSVFLHEFIDHRITNFQALAGNPTPGSLTLTPSDAAVPGVNAVRINPGAGFEYVLGTPLPQVIGISCRVRLLYPINPQPQMFPVIRLGAGAELLMWPLTHPLPDLTGTLSLARVWIGSGYKNLGNIVLPARNFVEFRFDWHTSGQARILADGRLVAYHNAVSPGVSFAVDRVAFGMPNTQPPSAQPLYQIARVFVRVLQRPDALAHFSKLLPEVNPIPDQNRCRMRVMSNILATVDRLRAFMAAFHQARSQPWSEQTGPAAGPFQPDATKAHTLAVAAVAELVRMLRTNDFAEPQRFLDPFTDFLRILYASQPQQFAALAADLDATKIVPDDCRAMFEAAVDESREALAPIIKLLTEASDRARRIAGGN